MTEHKVGQVLFVVLKSKSQVLPMQIIEMITKKTLTGEVINYVVQGGSDPKTNMMLHEIDGEIFDSSDAARSALIERASRQINRLVDVAIQRSKEWYPNGFEERSDNALTGVKKQPEQKVTFARAGVEEDTMIELADGTKVKVTLPDVLKS